MELDWKLILTHMLGFVITVVILAKFAWRPILGILDERREKIKSEFDQIESGKSEIEETKAGYDAKLKDIDNLARQKLTEAVNDGQKVAAEIKEQGRDEAKEIIFKAKAETDREVEKARAALKEDMVKMTIAAAEKIISKKLDEQENRRLIKDFIDSVEKA
ncbi:MAG: F0F1 ATP synthase subunit B [candidate division Zixibacteria bacterium]|nr:F0F1 ATP synthase subunit B [candidate division Zixibacteria bacterium]